MTKYAPVELSLLQHAHWAGRSFIATLSRDRQRAAGQFMTPPKIAEFMAKRLVQSVDHAHIRLLEPSAGAGILVAATVEALLEKNWKPAVIEAILYEKDPRLLHVLEELCQKISDECAKLGVQYRYSIKGEDFLLSELALRGKAIDGLVTIANPPFYKLNKSRDEQARLHGYAVYGQPNVYGLFMAATARLIPPDGRWCFITPRSWMNGKYFKAVRQTVLRHLSIDSLHAFESRTESFEQDAVLQETVIAWGTGRATRESGINVIFTRSDGIADLDRVSVQTFPVESIVANDEHAAVTLPTENAAHFDCWTATLATFGLKVSTGPVVAFRNREFITVEATPDTVPLLWMQHVSQQKISWPINKKMEHMRATAENAWMLLPNAPMVIMRRFSPKEDLRRVTCAAYLGELPGRLIALENHLNYIYRPNGKMSLGEVRGLSALLTSQVMDTRLRAIAGSTQINATELRSLTFPPLSVIEAIGERLRKSPSVNEIDTAVELELGLISRNKKAA